LWRKFRKIVVFQWINIQYQFILFCYYHGMFLRIVLFFALIFSATHTYASNFDNKWIIDTNVTIKKPWAIDTTVDIIEWKETSTSKIVLSKNISVEWGFWKTVDTNKLFSQIVTIVEITITFLTAVLVITLLIAGLLMIFNTENREKFSHYKGLMIKIVIYLLFFNGLAIWVYFYILTFLNNPKQKQIIENNKDQIKIDLIK